MSASIKKKVSQNRTKLQQTKQNKQQTTIFLPEINKVFLRPILQNLKGRSVLDKFFFENDPLDELNQMPLSKKFYIFGSWSKTQNSDQNRIYPSLTLLTAKFFPLKRVLKNSSPWVVTIYQLRSNFIENIDLNISLCTL